MATTHPQTRTAFASAQIIPFPAEAIRWVREGSDQVALIDARGRVERFANEPQLHAEVLERYPAEEPRAREAAQRIDALHRIAKAQLRVAAWLALYAVCVWGCFEIVSASLRLLQELAP